MYFPVKLPNVFRKVFLQNTYGRLLLEVVSENILQNSCPEIIFIYKDEHVALDACKCMRHDFKRNKTYH